MGFHSFLQSQNVPWESVIAKSWNMRMFKHIRGMADLASKALAFERGACPDAADWGVMERFSHKLSIAPTASISIIAGNSSLASSRLRRTCSCKRPCPAAIACATGT
jgi:ribonucleoside-diphosphate reductase alpha chain